MGFVLKYLVDAVSVYFGNTDLKRFFITITFVAGRYQVGASEGWCRDAQSA